jgi:LAO/AO transport system kinase
MQSLAAVDSQQGSARRIGFSGPPGAGKSSLIAAWAARRLAQQRRVGVIAIDPSSPLSKGCVLGDRIRMDGITEHPDFYLRSVASRAFNDGLCPNTAGLLDELELAGFDDVLLETVGVGQTDYALRSVVDTFVMVLNPEGGDVVQAMKAGILEVADILVVHKADLPAAKRMARDVASVVALRAGSSWRPSVIEVSAVQRTGLDDFEASINAHARFIAGSPDRRLRLQLRRRYRLQTAIEVLLDQILTERDPETFEQSLPLLLVELLEQLKNAAGNSMEN